MLLLLPLSLFSFLFIHPPLVIIIVIVILPFDFFDLPNSSLKRYWALILEVLVLIVEPAEVDQVEELYLAVELHFDDELISID